MCKNGYNNYVSSLTGPFWGATVTSKHNSYSWISAHTTHAYCLTALPAQSTFSLNLPPLRFLDTHSLSLAPWKRLLLTCPHIRKAFTGHPKQNSGPCPQITLLFPLPCFIVLHRTYFFSLSFFFFFFSVLSSLDCQLDENRGFCLCCLSLKPSTVVGTKYAFSLPSFLSSFQGCTGGIWSSQARGGIRDVAASLCHSHSNVRSKPHL